MPTACPAGCWQFSWRSCSRFTGRPWRLPPCWNGRRKTICCRITSPGWASSLPSWRQSLSGTSPKSPIFSPAPASSRWSWPPQLWNFLRFTKISGKPQSSSTPCRIPAASLRGRSSFSPEWGRRCPTTACTPQPSGRRGRCRPCTNRPRWFGPEIPRACGCLPGHPAR